MSRRFIEMAALSDAGRVRQFNEDSIAADPEIGLAVLADGMGGHRAGEVASRMAVELVFQGLRADLARFRSGARTHSTLDAVSASMDRANSAVYGTARGDASCHGMGTTLAVALFRDNRVTLGHIGDSRIYRLRDARLELLTRDDSLVTEEIERGLISAADAAGSHNRSLVTGALGVDASVRPHLAEEPARCGDVYLLCSDGLSDLVDDADIELIVDGLKSNLALAADHLVQTAKDNGGFDNVSVILAKVVRAFPAGSERSWTSRLLGWLAS